MASRKPNPGQVYVTALPDEAVSFDLDAFDRQIRTQGVTFIHWRGMRCPVGMVDQYDSRRPHDDHEGCSNGFLYTCAGPITCLFVGNSTSTDIKEMGMVDGSNVSVTLPRFYDVVNGADPLPLFIAPFDRVFLAEESIVVVNWQLFQAHVSGWDKLKFPVVDVQDLVDSQGRVYTKDDFEVVRGQIHWTGSRRPGMDPSTGKGVICAIRYTYRPYWYVKSLGHEVRVSQAENPVTGNREVQRLPQAVVLQREYVFENEDKDMQAKNPDSVRQVKGPSDGSFGPR